MNSSDDNFEIEVREQLFHNNSHFFDETPEKIIERDRLAKKWGFPSTEQEKRLDQGLDAMYY